MVGYDLSKKLTETDYIIAGANAGFLTRMTCQPFDVLKIRFQLQVEPISKAERSKYCSLYQAISLIAREEGISSFWKGHVAGQLLSITFGLTQFTTFEVLTKKAVLLRIPEQWNSAINFAAGSVAGCTATVISFPFDVIRTRLVAQGGNSSYQNIVHAFRTIIKIEGGKALYKGIFPAFLQIAPHTGVQFMSYKIFNSLYNKYLNSLNTTFTNSLVSGSLAGFCAKLTIYPFDLIKKRIQVQGFYRGNTFGKEFVCKGFFNCLANIYKYEGFLGFYKGLGPGLLKGVATSAMYFVTYELTCDILNKVHV